MTKIFNSKKGFTLVELALYMGLFSAFLLVLVHIFMSILDVQTESEATSAVAQDARYILSRLSYDMQNASAITTPATISAQTNTLQITINAISYIYAVQNGSLTLTNNLGSDMLNSYDTTVSNLTFKRTGNVGGKNAIQTNFTLTSKARRVSGSEIRDFQTTLGLR